MSILGGAENATISLANELSKEYKVTLCSLFGKKINEAYHIDSSIKSIFLDMQQKRLIKQQREFNALLKKTDLSCYKYCICAGYYPSFIVLPIKKSQKKIKLVFWDHGAVESQKKEKKTTLVRYIDSLRCDFTVTLTNSSSRYYVRKFKIKKNKVFTIYNWIDLDTIPYETNYNFDSKKIITVGRFTKEKGMDQLPYLAKQVLRSSDWRWIVYGDGILKSSVQEAIDNLDLSNKIILVGEEKDKNKIYSDASILVMPSYREGLPLVLLEGKAYKIPEVAFDVLTGPNEIIDNNVNGFLIHPGDLDDMVKKIQLLINDISLRKNMSKRTWDDIEKFNKKTVISKWKEILK